MATLADIQTKIYELTGTDSSSYPNANMAINLNIWNQKIVGAIIDSQDETDFDDQRNITASNGYPIFTFPLTTSRDYTFPISLNILKIKDFSITYDGVNYYRGTPLDDTESVLGIAPSSATTANTTIDASYSKVAPRYDIKYNALWLYPAAIASDAIGTGAQGIIEIFRGPIDYTSSDVTTGTAVPGFDSTFHMMLAYGAAFEYASAKQIPQLNIISRELADYEMRLRKQYSSKQLDRNYTLTANYQSMK